MEAVTVQNVPGTSMTTKNFMPGAIIKKFGHVIVERTA
jgi:hypothetical protein